MDKKGYAFGVASGHINAKVPNVSMSVYYNCQPFTTFLLGNPIKTFSWGMGNQTTMTE